MPELIPLVFTRPLQNVIKELFGEAFFVAKSIYSDKPESSNRFVSYHQDLTISVDKKLDIEGFGPWTTKQDQYVVQPPLQVFQSNFTIRIHLDDTYENNGVLKVIPGSQSKGIYRPKTIDWTEEKEITCRMRSGSIMIMRPLSLRASNRTSNNKGRRIIHVEFSKHSLQEPLEWAVKIIY